MKNKYENFVMATYKTNYYNGIREFLDLSKNWNFIIRNKIAKYGKPTKILFKGEHTINGHLFISVDRFMLLEYEGIKKKIMNWINIYFAKTAIIKITILPAI